MPEITNPRIHVDGRELFLVAIAKNVSVQNFACLDDLGDVKTAGLINHVHDKAHHVLGEFVVREIDAKRLVKLLGVNCCGWSCWLNLSKPIANLAIECACQLYDVLRCLSISEYLLQGPI